MVRPIIGDKWRAGGVWTEARYKSFITSLLRQGTRRWAPIGNALRKAKVRRGFYLCNVCHETVPLSVKIEGVRKKNAIVDHILPVVDPTIGFVDWNTLIDRMFCEDKNLQVLCKTCHDAKTTLERGLAKARRAREKE